MNSLIIPPMVTPSLAMAVAVYNIYKLDTDLKLTRTMTSFVFAHTVMASLRETDRKLEYAATSLGAGRFATLRKVVFPSLSILICGLRKALSRKRSK